MLANMANNLPAEFTSFVGRERELAEIKGLLADTRLLTLIGPGGVGKTRLAVRLAREIGPNYSDGVWLVELASLRAGELVPQALAAVFGLVEKQGTSIRNGLIEHLHLRQALLVLDNCEHLLDACANITVELLTACPSLSVLTTSREPLNLLGEVAWLVPSLAVPDSYQSVGTEQAWGSEAVRLFTERAAAARPGFRLTDENAPTVSQICRRLDGIPLAIELAAVRIRALTVQQIAARLNDRFQLLSGSSRGSVPRHVTLRASIDWSHQLLSEHERVLFRRLGVFDGGWSLEAAEEVCGGEPLQQPVLDLLSQLVDKSVVTAEGFHGPGRYRFLETVREYATEELRDSGELAALQRRHARWFARRAESVRPEVLGPDLSACYQEIAVELDNIRAALDWCSSEDALLGLELAGSLMMFWYRWGHLSEGRAHLAHFLARCEESPEQKDDQRRWIAARARGMLSAGQLAMRQRHADAAKLLDVSLALAQRSGDGCAVAAALSYRGRLAYQQGDLSSAKRRINQALVTAREVSMPWIVCHALHGLGMISQAAGDPAKAKEHFQAVLTVARELNDRWWAAIALRGLIILEIEHGQLDAARTDLLEAIDLQQNSGFRMEAPFLTLTAAWLASCRDQPLQAMRLAGAAEGLMWRYGNLPDAPLPDVAACMAIARQTLGDWATAAWNEGHALAAEQALEEAMAMASESAMPRHTHARPDDAGLTPREREIAMLMARRLTNHEIAQLLVVSNATVKTHVENILGKLGLRSRREVTAWAEQTNLVESTLV